MDLFKTLFDFVWKIGAGAFLGLLAWDFADIVMGINRGPYLPWVIGGGIVGLLFAILGLLK